MKICQCVFKCLPLLKTLLNNLHPTTKIHFEPLRNIAIVVKDHGLTALLWQQHGFTSVDSFLRKLYFPKNRQVDKQMTSLASNFRRMGCRSRGAVPWILHTFDYGSCLVCIKKAKKGNDCSRHHC